MPAVTNPAVVESRGAPSEELEIHTEDGVALRATVREPRQGVVAGTAVLAHAMFARRSEFERPQERGVADMLVARGWRTVAFDFRGHGESGKSAGEGGSWGYDDLVRYDMPAVVGCAKARFGKKPVVVVGHSLGGHVAVAAQGTGRLGADAIVLAAANVWVRALEPSLGVWAAKRAVMEIFERVAARRGYFPARALRQGSDDEALAYVRDVARFARTNRWRSADGRDDYLDAMRDVRVPVVQIASTGDRLNCRPVSARAFVERCGGPIELVLAERADDGGPAPGHMEIVTTPSVREAWSRAETWVRSLTHRINSVKTE
jgi:predicted alpha/beta hydrolase